MNYLKFYCLLSTAYCLLPTSSPAQWLQGQKVFGTGSNDFAFGLQQTTDGGYIITGGTNISGPSEAYLIKIDANADMVWSKIYAGVNSDWTWGVHQTTDGGYVLAGHTYSFGAGSGDVFLIKTDTIGDTLWTKAYGGASDDFGYTVRQTTDGGYILVGHTPGYGAGGWDVYLIKTNDLGDTLWTRTYGGVNAEDSRTVRQTNDGGYIIAGNTFSFGAVGSDAYLIKTDSVGNLLWSKTYGGAGNEYIYSVGQTADNGYILLGETSGFGAGLQDMYLIKTNAFGDTLWTRTYGGSANDVGWSVGQTADSGYILAGQTFSFGAGLDDVYLIKTDVNGDTVWTKTYGGGNADYARAVQQTTDGGYIVAGETRSFGAGQKDVYLIKTDANGNSGCNEMNTNTIISGGAIVSNPATIVGSGTIINNTTLNASTPPTIEDTLCTVFAYPITSNFVAADSIICIGSCINFSDSSTGLITSWKWSFPGATPSSSTDQNPTNICYDTTGTYDVTLIAANAVDSDTLTQTGMPNRPKSW